MASGRRGGGVLPVTSLQEPATSSAGARYRSPWTGALDRNKVWDRSLVLCVLCFVSWGAIHRPPIAPGRIHGDCVRRGLMGHTSAVRAVQHLQWVRQR